MPGISAGVSVEMCGFGNLFFGYAWSRTRSRWVASQVLGPGGISLVIIYRSLPS